MFETTKQKFSEYKAEIAVLLAFVTEISVSQLGKEFRNSNRAQSGNMINKGVNLAVGILVVGLLTAYLLPIAINELVAVDTSSWGDAEAALFGLLPLFFVLGILLFIIGKAMNAK